MGVIDKLKRLHKQTLLKLKDIKRVVIADEAGVNNEEYLSRVRTLNSYLNPNLEESEAKLNANEEVVQQKNTQSSSTVKSATKPAAKKTKSINL